jgi:TolB-like protein/Flp pilus assembly protein TadD
MVRFGAFELDLCSRELRKHGLKVKLQDQPFQVLAMLVEEPRRVVTREEIRKRVWGDSTHVDFDRSINKAVNRLRQLLGDMAEGSRFIETLPKLGYRFLVAVEDRITSLAVLPLDYLAENAAEEYFTDSLTEELIMALSQITGLRVISRTSVMRYKRARKPLAEIARELGVDAVLEGTVLRSGSKLRITASLVRARDETQIWRNSFERIEDETIGLQNELAQAVATQIQSRLRSATEAGAPDPRPVRSGAHDEFLKARYFWNKRTPDDFDRSIQHFRCALEADSQYARAWAGLADVYVMLGMFGLQNPHEVFPQARTAAENALRLDDSLAEAHASLAEIHAYYDWDWRQAERQYRRAIELDPNYATAYQYYAHLLAMLGRQREALEQIEEARKYDPLSPPIGSFVSYICICGRQFERAVAEARKALELDSNFGATRLCLGLAYQGLNRPREAIRELKAAIRSSGNLSVFQAHLGYICARAGRHPEALAILDDLRQRSLSRHVPRVELARVFLGLDDKPAALDLLEEAYQTRDARIAAIREPFFSDLSAEPRYRALFASLELPVEI